ncbi:helix-turn-helix domain-containing protein [Phytobacter diazotrophicus]
MTQPDWHPADLIAGLKKQGTSLFAISRKSGLASSTLAKALNSHWPKGEGLVAEELGGTGEDLAFSLIQPKNCQNKTDSPDLLPAFAGVGG